MSEREAARTQGIPRWTLNDWLKTKEEIFAYAAPRLAAKLPRRKKTPLLLTSLCFDCSAASHIGIASFSERQAGSRKTFLI
ncbi:hypothetical protein PC116_g23363 [Phytophthora cactorum]|nr:hypothetical protein PC116_g23363 [Phytophthora cactorum]